MSLLPKGHQDKRKYFLPDCYLQRMIGTRMTRIERMNTDLILAAQVLKNFIAFLFYCLRSKQNPCSSAQSASSAFPSSRVNKKPTVFFNTWALITAFKSKLKNSYGFILRSCLIHLVSVDFCFGFDHCCCFHGFKFCED